MDKLLEISQILEKWGHKLRRNDSVCTCCGYLEHITEHHNIISIGIHIYKNHDNQIDTDKKIYIEVKLSSSEIYKNYGYNMYPPFGDSDHVFGSKSFQSFEDLLDELQSLELINCGHSIKG